MKTFVFIDQKTKEEIHIKAINLESAKTKLQSLKPNYHQNFQLAKNQIV
jgi:hypothetical protein